jgi:ribosomal protein S18 acetylase RimI-like enzyme
VEAEDQRDLVVQLYGEVYAEAPYLEGPAQVGEFAGSWSMKVREPGFCLVVASLSGVPVGFTFGHRLGANTDWWGSLLDRPSVDTSEWEGRTFAIIELAVRCPHRRQGIGAQLHREILTSRREERVTLFSRAEAEPAQQAYRSWGYRPVGRARPDADAPEYVVMLRELRSTPGGHRAFGLM